MAKIKELTPYFLDPPYTLRTKFTEAKFADKAAQRPGVKRLDAVTLEIEHSDHLDLIM